MFQCMVTQILLIDDLLFFDHFIYIEPSRSTAIVYLYNLEIVSREIGHFLSRTSFLTKPEQLACVDVFCLMNIAIGVVDMLN
jgi:hypothetical protein